MKKLIAFLLVLVTVLSLCACGGKEMTNPLEKLTPGLTREEVYKIFGEPDGTADAGCKYNDMEGFGRKGSLTVTIGPEGVWGADFTIQVTGDKESALDLTEKIAQYCVETYGVTSNPAVKDDGPMLNYMDSWTVDHGGELFLRTSGLVNTGEFIVQVYVVYQ